MIRPNIVMIQALFSQLLTDLGELEGDYRAFHLKDDIALSIFSFSIASVSILTMLRADLFFFQDAPSLFAMIALSRIIYVTITISVMLAVLKTSKVKKFDRLLCVWLFFTVIYLVAGNFLRPSDYTTASFAIIVPFAIYLLSPLRISTNAILAFTFSAGILFVEYFLKTGEEFAPLGGAIAAQLVVHTLGFGASIQLQSYRRKSFKAYIEEKDAKEMVAYLANIDPLTKSLTRRQLFNIAESEFLRFIRYRRPLSMLIIDADHFKNINDSYGHHTGDVVLRSLSLVAMEQKRAQDTFGRLGGEEFGLILPETNLEQAKVVAERIQKTWADSPVNIDGKLIHSTVSIGVAEAKPDDVSFDDILRRADRMLYKAKEAGRNRVVAE
ncbi:MAG: GGDEF domain-containing protein [Chloroflexi bacterium]|nr:GGDEF domain-containing protein [Chloroflexota bacterium]